ncbi:Cardiolipin synthase [Polystyrenella longa]|uniref:Cardiolipin synthase n=1 Tax=Polystyrenella longa TaxID=2528007 RepID=A0A518CTL5_9PLAN|nr:cardiolipin synthase [Polystyrenella longa]QDU82555.1 Cardiolipin synthase [Polystyrenella longa]
MSHAISGVLIHLMIQVFVILRVLTRPHRDPSSRIAWIAVIASLPVLGILLYLLFGETSIGRSRIKRLQQVFKELPETASLRLSSTEQHHKSVPEQYRHLFSTGRSISGFENIGGNTASLMADSNSTIDAMIADIDEAQDHVHLLFYIWLGDHNGTRMVEALKRAASRGVICRAIADDLGSRKMIHSPLWKDLEAAGVKLARALPIGNPLTRPLHGRIDLRNHRKILIIDGRVTYCGSQNCADPEFLVKAKYAPWVDIMIRLEGPVVQQNQYLFISDWMSSTSDDIGHLIKQDLPAPQEGFPAQVIGTGPTVRFSAMPEMFESLFHAARQELIISTPYFVPDESMLSALCAAAWRGVNTTLIVPARNDSWIVAAASRSYYADLLKAGVHIHEFQGGLLHAKTLTMDGEVGLIGSANMDRRSFDLNFENNILFYDHDLTSQIRSRQQAYISSSQLVSLESVQAWSLTTRLWNNIWATMSPVL